MQYRIALVLHLLFGISEKHDDGLGPQQSGLPGLEERSQKQREPVRPSSKTTTLPNTALQFYEGATLNQKTTGTLWGIHLIHLGLKKVVRIAVSLISPSQYANPGTYLTFFLSVWCKANKISPGAV